MSVSGFRLFDGVNSGLERVLDLREAQHTLVSSNLANADTPGYLAREMPFGELLAEVMDAAMSGEEGDEIPGVADAEVTERPADPSALDGNSVDAEHEAGTLAYNTVLYNALTTGVSRRLALLRFAASDGKA